MALFNPKKNLGKLFGGHIASINYSLQTSSQVSGATLVVLSEDSKFDEPSFNDIVTVPPFGLRMKVVEFSKRRNSANTSLQVELQEEISSVLDNELVLIYGIHTDPYYNINNESFLFSKSMFIDRSNWLNKSFNPSVRFPDQQKNPVISYGDGINVIGISRVSNFTAGNMFFSTSEGATPFKDPQIVVYDHGSINNELSNFSDPTLTQWTTDKESNSNLKFGYTLKNLYNLFLEKGVSFDKESESIMQNDTFLFSDSGTLRNCLAACLSKLGRSFYVDPFSQKIKIISNSDIAQINSNLADSFENITDGEGVTTTSYSKSIRDVEAKHLFLKGSYDTNNNVSVNRVNIVGDGGDPVIQRQVIYKYSPESSDILGTLNESDLKFLAALSPVVESLESEALNTYALALRLRNGYQTSTIYGDNVLKFGEVINKAAPSDWKNKIKEEFNRTGQDQLNNQYIGSYYDFNKTKDGTQLIGKLPSETDLFQLASDYAKLNFGLYFSAPLSESQLENRQYQSLGDANDGNIDDFGVIPVLRNKKIRQVPELAFLVRLLAFNDRDISNITIEQLAKSAYKDAGSNPAGGGEYVLLCIKDLFTGLAVDGEDSFVSDIKSNSLIVNIDRKKGINTKHLLLSTEFDSVFKEIYDATVVAFLEERSNMRAKKQLRFIRVRPDSGGSSDGNNDDNEPSLSDINSIDTIKSDVKNFSKRSSQVIDQNILEKRIFQENIQDIIPYFEGPFIKASVSYFRPPVKEDLDITKGVSSISISMSSQGITTNVNYSSLKFKDIDFNLLSETFGYSNSIPTAPLPNLPAFRKK
jgi:hypothetical protein